MKEHKGRIQRSGFFVDHPYLLRAGFGVSCKYGRIWTPANLDRNELISLAVGSINKLDTKHTPAKGLGRLNDKIKGLYAQVFIPSLN